MSAHPDARALQVSLDPPRAFGTPPAAGRLRATPEDFVVDEDLGFEPDGDGPHFLLRVRKRAANTEFVARELARHARARPPEVGFAGLKDRNAVTTQWFSVPRGALQAPDWLALSHPEFEVLEAHPHRRKLRRGALAGNRFQLCIRELAAQPAALEERIAALRERGVPNYFGEQRFGRDGGNLARAFEWARTGQEPRARGDVGFALSAARSAIFNAVLAERVQRGDWQTLLDGDVANLQGSGSVFAVPVVDETLRRRTADFDLHPTGPLWGVGESMASGAVRELERAVSAGFEPLAALLEREGLRAERRSLRLKVEDLHARVAGDTLTLEFRLDSGAFATTVLRELL